MIKHEQKHKILKHFAEAGNELLQSSMSDEVKHEVYLQILGVMQKLEGLEEEGECNCEAYETEETIPLEEAVGYLSDGHGLRPPKRAFSICKAFGVPFPKKLLRHWYSDWSDPKGMHMNEGSEGALGIWSLELSAYIAEKLGVKEKAGDYLGRGFQAQAYAREIRKLLVEQGKLKDKEA